MKKAYFYNALTKLAQLKIMWYIAFMNRMQANLRKKMLEVGESAHSIEKKLGLGNGSVRNILIGETENPRKKTLERICGLLNCSVEDLFVEVSYGNDVVIQWDRSLFGECLNTMTKLIRDAEIKPSQEMLISLTEDLYEFSFRDSKVDENFANLLLKKYYK